MNELDPLIYHLHRRGSGSWAWFSRAVEAFDASIDPRSCARALAEHAIVEFDFDHGRDWSVTSVQLVDASGGTVAWGGTARVLVARDDLAVEKGRRSVWIDGYPFTYEHCLRVRKRGSDWPRTLAPIKAGLILDVIPSLPAIVGSRPLGDVPLRKAERLNVTTFERSNPGGFRRYELRSTWEPSAGVSVRDNAVWKLDRATYVVSRNHMLFWAQPEIALWTGFLFAADRLGIEHLLHYNKHERALLVAAYPRLSVAYVRALLLSGARESASERRDKRVFRNVDAKTAEWLLQKLSI